MSVANMLSQRITGITPFDELPIDAAIWKESHDHHHKHRRLHASITHRPGIVYGLDVIASRRDERTVIIAPGVAIDPAGETVVLADSVKLTLEESRVNYIIFTFVETRDSNSALEVSGGKQYYRMVENRRAQVVKELPETPYIELARILRTGTEKQIKDAEDPFDPGKDEINLLYRPLSFPHCFADCTVAELSYVGLTNPSERPPNRAGLCTLLRSAGAAGFHVTLTQPLDPEASKPDPLEPALVYMAGRQGFQPRTDTEVDGLRRYLSRGGTFFGESGGSEHFSEGFKQLASKLGAKLKPVEAGSPLLTSYVMFGGAPPGSNVGGELLADLNAGVVFSTYDYGAAWQGEVDESDPTRSRERIRQATEFGLNMVAFAARRMRVSELSRLS